GRVATLILPADVSWGEGGQPSPPPSKPEVQAADDATVEAIADLVKSGKRCAILLGGRALREGPIMDAARVARKHGVQLFAECFPTRMERGAGLPPIDRIAYLGELVGVQLGEVEHLILVDAKSPVSFFAYPGKPSDLVPEGCSVHTLAKPEQDAAA